MPAFRAAVLALVLVACGDPEADRAFTPGPPPTSAPVVLPPPTLPDGTPVDVPDDPVPVREAPPIDERYTCTTDAECILVNAPCGAVQAANRTHAAEIQAAYDALAAATVCAQLTEAPGAVGPACLDGVCRTRPLDAPH